MPESLEIPTTRLSEVAEAKATHCRFFNFPMLEDPFFEDNIRAIPMADVTMWHGEFSKKAEVASVQDVWNSLYTSLKQDGCDTNIPAQWCDLKSSLIAYQGMYIRADESRKSYMKSFNRIHNILNINEIRNTQSFLLGVISCYQDVLAILETFTEQEKTTGMFAQMYQELFQWKCIGERFYTLLEESNIISSEQREGIKATISEFTATDATNVRNEKYYQTLYGWFAYAITESIEIPNEIVWILTHPQEWIEIIHERNEKYRAAYLEIAKYVPKILMDISAPQLLTENPDFTITLGTNPDLPNLQIPSPLVHEILAGIPSQTPPNKRQGDVMMDGESILWGLLTSDLVTYDKLHTGAITVTDDSGFVIAVLRYLNQDGHLSYLDFDEQSVCRFQFKKGLDHYQAKLKQDFISVLVPAALMTLLQKA